MPAIQEHPAMRKKIFEGTDKEFEAYRKKRPVSDTKRFTVYEDDQKEENFADVKKQALIQLFKQTEESYKRGEAVPFTTELVDSLNAKAQERFSPSEK